MTLLHSWKSTDAAGPAASIIIPEPGAASQSRGRPAPRYLPAAFAGRGKDRSQRPYFDLAKNRSGIAITEPYLSIASRKLAISAAVKGKEASADEYLVPGFDLGKTTLEEEVLMHKDIFRHSATRRTITRFVGAILIAVSIESLLLMFKAALGEGDQLIKAVWMMLAAVGLLTGLGIYVYLGAKAEATLIEKKR